MPFRNFSDWFEDVLDGEVVSCTGSYIGLKIHKSSGNFRNNLILDRICFVFLFKLALVFVEYCIKSIKNKAIAYFMFYK